MFLIFILHYLLGCRFIMSGEIHIQNFHTCELIKIHFSVFWIQPWNSSPLSFSFFQKRCISWILYFICGIRYFLVPVHQILFILGLPLPWVTPVFISTHEHYNILPQISDILSLLDVFYLASSCLSQFFFYNSPCFLAQASSLTRLLNCTTRNKYSFKYLKVFGWAWEGVRKGCLSFCLFSWDQVSHWTRCYVSIHWPQQPLLPEQQVTAFY